MSFIKEMLNLGGSMDREQQNTALRSVGIDPRRARSRLAKIRKRARSALSEE